MPILISVDKPKIVNIIVNGKEEKSLTIETQSQKVSWESLGKFQDS
jgi:hypothetical protein